jgi:hypothetical protein
MNYEAKMNVDLDSSEPEQFKRTPFRSEYDIPSSIETCQPILIPKSSMRKDSVFEGSFCKTEISQMPLPMNGFLCLAKGNSKYLPSENRSQRAKMTWCCIDGKGSLFLIYSSLSSYFKKEPPTAHLSFNEFTASPILLDGGNIVAFILKSKSSDACLIAYSPAGPNETIRWIRSIIQCDCKFEV